MSWAVLLLLLACAPSDALSIIGRPPAVRRLPHIMSGGQDEIAELEARLADLRQKEAEAAALEELEASTKAREEARKERGVATYVPTDSDAAGDWATLSNRRKVTVEKMAPPEELLSEAWKEDEAGGGFQLVPVLAGLGALLAFVAFSLVPIGQSSVDSVTYGGYSAPLETATQIKARYQGVDQEE